MGKVQAKTVVGYFTLTVTAIRGALKTVHTARLGFAGHLNNADIERARMKLAKIFQNQLMGEYPEGTKFRMRSRTTTTQCDMILNDGNDETTDE